MAPPVAALFNAAPLSAASLASHVELPADVVLTVAAASHVAAVPGIAALPYAASALSGPKVEPRMPGSDACCGRRIGDWWLGVCGWRRPSRKPLTGAVSAMRGPGPWSLFRRHAERHDADITRKLIKRKGGVGSRLDAVRCAITTAIIAAKLNRTSREPISQPVAERVTSGYELYADHG